MDIQLNKTSATDATIRILIHEADYKESLDKKIKDYARKANIRGFRQGKVPVGVVQNMFGKSFLADEVNSVLSKNLSGYIRENKLNVLGEPLPDESRAQAIDWETQKDFEFTFRIGMAGEFELKLDDKVKVQRNLIEVTDQSVDEATEQARNRYGNITYPEVSSEGDLLYGECRAAAAEQSTTGVITISKINAAARAKFTGLKKGDSTEFLIEEVSTDPDVVSQILNLEKEEAAARKGTYHFTVNTISKTEPAEMNQEFFDKVFGADQVHSEDEFRNKVRETIEKNYERESDHWLEHELEHHLVDHTTIALPEEFLKDWLKQTGEGKVTDEVLEKEFGLYLKETKWNLIRTRISEENQIQVDQNDVRDRAKAMIIEQFGGAAIADQLGDRMDGFADNYLQGNDGQNFMRLYNQLRNERIMKVIREKITITDKKVSLDEFRHLVSSHRH